MGVLLLITYRNTVFVRIRAAAGLEKSTETHIDATKRERPRLFMLKRDILGPHGGASGWFLLRYAHPPGTAAHV